MVVERAPQFFDQADERRIRHERVRPQPLVKFVLAHDARRFIDQKRQQIERLRREMYLAAVLQQLPAVCIELERPESRTHIESPEFPRSFPGTAPDLKRR